MSRFPELAAEEAARAEAEEPDEDEAAEEEEAEPESPPEPPAEPTQAPEALLRKFESENARHEKALGKIMGEDFEAFEPCAACGAIGFAIPQPPPDFKVHALTFECQECDGLGQLVSGSKVEAFALLTCPTCQGKGYREKAPVQSAQAPTMPLDPARYPPPVPTNGPTQAATFAHDPAVAQAIELLKARGAQVIPPWVPEPTGYGS